MKRQLMRGITLIELLLFIIIVSVALVGALAVFGPSAKGSADPMLDKQTLNLAEALLREVMQKSFQNDATDPGNTSSTLGCTPTTTPACVQDTPAHRANYNDVGDYNNYGPQVPVRIDGVTPVAGLVACTESVAVVAGNVDGVAGRLITVTVVCAPAGVATSITLTGFRTNYGG